MNARVMIANYWLKSLTIASACLLSGIIFAAPLIAKDEEATEAAAQVGDRQLDAREAPEVRFPVGVSKNIECDADFNKSTLKKVDETVRKYLYSKKLAETVWVDALRKNETAILNSKNLIELSSAINLAIAELKSSHCQFVTINDETFFFLHSLMAENNEEFKRFASTDFTGFVTGGVGFEKDRVRFILDGSSAKKTGLKVGDQILSVNGANYIGQVNFLGLSGSNAKLEISRNGTKQAVEIPVKFLNLYQQYARAVEKSAYRQNLNGHKIAYVHLWCGGSDPQEAMEAVVTSPHLQQSEGLILDLRDGYGACSLDALDCFYRPNLAYPDFTATDNRGHTHTYKMTYDKPVVALINGGSRSGKEMLAYSLKKTKRALLIGEKTAGYFLGGRLFSINDRTALYLAVSDCKVDGVRLEANGVAPNIEIHNDKKTDHDKQLEVAQTELIKRLRKPLTKSSPGKPRL